MNLSALQRPAMEIFEECMETGVYMGGIAPVGVGPLVMVIQQRHESANVSFVSKVLGTSHLDRIIITVEATRQS